MMKAAAEGEGRTDEEGNTCARADPVLVATSRRGDVEGAAAPDADLQRLGPGDLIVEKVQAWHDRAADAAEQEGDEGDERQESVKLPSAALCESDCCHGAGDRLTLCSCRRRSQQVQKSGEVPSSPLVGFDSTCRNRCFDWHDRHGMRTLDCGHR